MLAPLFEDGCTTTIRDLKLRQTQLNLVTHLTKLLVKLNYRTQTSALLLAIVCFFGATSRERLIIVREDNVLLTFIFTVSLVFDQMFFLIEIIT